MSESEQTQRVLAHHLQAFDAGDLDAVLSDYAADAVVLTSDGPRGGHDQIRSLLQWLAENIFTPDCQFRMIQQLVEGPIAYIVWAAESSGYRVPLACDTLLVRDGKIIIQTFAAQVERKER